MVKTLYKHLLSVCILLLSMHSFLYAHVNRDFIHYSSINPEGSMYTSFGMMQNSLSFVIKSVSSDKEKENNDQSLVVLDDDDDDDVVSFKKHLESNTCINSILFGQTPGSFSTYHANTVAFNTYFSHISSCRYLVFQVFRV